MKLNRIKFRPLPILTFFLTATVGLSAGQKVIVDTDIGDDFDDATALSLL